MNVRAIRVPDGLSEEGGRSKVIIIMKRKCHEIKRGHKERDGTRKRDTKTADTLSLSKQDQDKKKWEITVSSLEENQRERKTYVTPDGTSGPRMKKGTLMSNSNGIDLPLTRPN